jgi:hypothetical protein
MVHTARRRGDRATCACEATVEVPRTGQCIERSGAPAPISPSSRLLSLLSDSAQLRVWQAPVAGPQTCGSKEGMLVSEQYKGCLRPSQSPLWVICQIALRECGVASTRTPHPVTPRAHRRVPAPHTHAPPRSFQTLPGCGALLVRRWGTSRTWWWTPPAGGKSWGSSKRVYTRAPRP